MNIIDGVRRPGPGRPPKWVNNLLDKISEELSLAETPVDSTLDTGNNVGTLLFEGLSASLRKSLHHWRGLEMSCTPSSDVKNSQTSVQFLTSPHQLDMSSTHQHADKSGR